MMEILSSLLYRLKRNKLFYILLGVSFLLTLLSYGLLAALVDLAETDLASLAEGLGGLGFGSSPLHFMTDGLNPSANLYLLAIISICIFLCKEFSNGTMRNVILANKSRTQMYFAYYLIAFLMCLCFLLLNLVETGVIYGLSFGFGELTASQIASGILVIIALSVCTSLFVVSAIIFFLFVTRKTGATVVLSILVASLLPSLVITIAQFAGLFAMIEGDIVNDYAISWVPFYQLSLFDPTAINPKYAAHIAIDMLGLSAIFGSLGYVIFRKANLK